ncbi:hypothetical protein Tco_0198426, partial [Tanacetum coccineum]
LDVVIVVGLLGSLKRTPFNFYGLEGLLLIAIKVSAKVTSSGLTLTVVTILQAVVTGSSVLSLSLAALTPFLALPLSSTSSIGSSLSTTYVPAKSDKPNICSSSATLSSSILSLFLLIPLE